MSHETVEITFLGSDITVVGDYSPGQRGRTDGPPEDCYPDEPSNFEIEDILVNGCSIYEMCQCCAIAQNTQPISHRDFLIELAEAVCLKLDEAEPDFDEPDACYPDADE